LLYASTARAFLIYSRTLISNIILTFVFFVALIQFIVRFLVCITWGRNHMNARSLFSFQNKFYSFEKIKVPQFFQRDLTFRYVLPLNWNNSTFCSCLSFSIFIDSYIWIFNFNNCVIPLMIYYDWDQAISVTIIANIYVYCLSYLVYREIIFCTVWKGHVVNSCIE